MSGFPVPIFVNPFNHSTMLFFAEGNQILMAISREERVSSPFPMGEVTIVYEGDFAGFGVLFHPSGILECAVQVEGRHIVYLRSHNMGKAWREAVSPYTESAGSRHLAVKRVKDRRRVVRKDEAASSIEPHIKEDAALMEGETAVPPAYDEWFDESHHAKEADLNGELVGHGI